MFHTDPPALHQHLQRNLPERWTPVFDLTNAEEVAENKRKADKKMAQNADLWKEMLELIEKHEVRLHWVKGHAENPYNNRCDEMAVNEWKAVKERLGMQ